MRRPGPEQADAAMIDVISNTFGVLAMLALAGLVLASMPGPAPEPGRLDLPWPRMRSDGYKVLMCKGNRVSEPVDFAAVVGKLLAGGAAEAAMTFPCFDATASYKDEPSASILIKPVNLDRWTPAGEVMAEGSAFMRSLKGLAAGKGWLVLFVWPDSFEAARNVQRLGRRSGLHIGFSPMSQEDDSVRIGYGVDGSPLSGI